MLSDLGAEVVKVEPPGGAASRSSHRCMTGPVSRSHVRNAGKHSVVIDPETPAGARAPAHAARRRRHLDRDDPARRAVGAGPGARRGARPQSGACRAVDHGLRPRPVRIGLGGDRSRAAGDGRRAQPLGSARPRAAHAAGGYVARADRRAGGLGGTRRLLEPPRGRATATGSTSRSTKPPPRRSSRRWAPSAPRRRPATNRPMAAPRPVHIRSSAVATDMCGSCCWRRASGRRCGPGSAIPTSCAIPSLRRSAAGRWRPTACTPSSSGTSPGAARTS